MVPSVLISPSCSLPLPEASWPSLSPECVLLQCHIGQNQGSLASGPIPLKSLPRRWMFSLEDNEPGKKATSHKEVPQSDSHLQLLPGVFYKYRPWGAIVMAGVDSLSLKQPSTQPFSLGSAQPGLLQAFGKWASR